MGLNSGTLDLIVVSITPSNLLRQCFPRLYTETNDTNWQTLNQVSGTSTCSSMEGQTVSRGLISEISLCPHPPLGEYTLSLQPYGPDSLVLCCSCKQATTAGSWPSKSPTPPQFSIPGYLLLPLQLLLKISHVIAVTAHSIHIEVGRILIEIKNCCSDILIN